MEYYVARHGESIIGLGNTEVEATAEPIDNGYLASEITVTQISAVEYQKYIDLYT